MAFKVPPSKKDDTSNRFEFEWPDTSYGAKPGAVKVHSIPLLEYLPVSAAEAFELGQEVTGLLLGCDTEETRAIVRSLDGDQFSAFMDAWEQASKTSVGESPVS